MLKKLRLLYLTARFFWSLLGLVGLFVLAFIFPFLLLVAKVITGAFFVVILLDFFLLFLGQGSITIRRKYPEKISNGDQNEFEISVRNTYSRKLHIRILEELPLQFQYRDFTIEGDLRPSQEKRFSYMLRPTERGEYRFGKCNVLVTDLGFLSRRFRLEEDKILACYPSFIQLKKYSLLATTNRLTAVGVKKIRRIGTTLEFELIKEYVPGDDYRFINWKATAKVHKMMVNQYEDEKSQPIYSLIDLGRAMRMPFEELTLLDYAINASLVLSNIAILKGDRAGLLTFSDTLQEHIPPSKRSQQMRLIANALYRVKTDFKEPEFGRLYTYARRKINRRALLFLYTNFETVNALKRQLPYLRLLNKSHIVVVVIFSNTELTTLAGTRGRKLREIYNQVVAEGFVYEKDYIIRELQANGLQTILTEPQNLTINSINKYLELKARGWI